MAEEERRGGDTKNETTTSQIDRIDKEGLDEESRDRFGGFRHNHTAEPLKEADEPAEGEKTARRD